jgi:hypothetical protein
MVDQYGRPTMEDGLNLMRTAMTFQNFSNQQKEFAQKEKAWNEKDLADKYFGMKSKGQDIPTDSPDYNPTADLAADQMMNQKWQAGQVKQVAQAEDTLAKMPDDQVLNFQPKTYAEHIVAANRIKEIGSNQQNRQAIDELNNQKAGEAYKYSINAFNEARSKLSAGDSKGAADELVKIGQITNNPFKARPSADGKTVDLYWTKDGVDQHVETYPIDKALGVVQQHLNGDEFFKSHLQNREARKAMNEKSLLNPTILEKGNQQLRAVRQLDLNSNQVSWSLYDKDGNLYKGQPINDINQVLKEGWKPVDLKAKGEALTQQKTAAEIIKTRALTQKTQAETAKIQAGDTGKTGKFRNDWWPKAVNETGTEDPNITAARGIVTRAYDNYKDPNTQKLIVSEVMPQYQKWLADNKEKMVTNPDGTQRPMDSQDLQNALDHIAYNIIQQYQKKNSPKKKSAPKQEIGLPEDVIATAHKRSPM